MPEPLEVRLRVEHTARHGALVVLDGLDITRYVRDMRFSAGVDDVTELELTLINIRINREDES